MLIACGFWPSAYRWQKVVLAIYIHVVCLKLFSCFMKMLPALLSEHCVHINYLMRLFIFFSVCMSVCILCQLWTSQTQLKTQVVIEPFIVKWILFYSLFRLPITPLLTNCMMFWVEYVCVFNIQILFQYLNFHIKRNNCTEMYDFD